MTDFPGRRHHLPTITWQSRESLGTIQRATAASAAWPNANRALYVPFFIHSPFLVRRLFWLDGAVLSGNVDIGLYTEQGRRLVSSGSTAQSGGTINTIRALTLGTPLVLTPAIYYMAMACDNVTSQFMRSQVGAVVHQIGGMAQQTAAFPLPATFTLARVAANNAPIFGLTSQTVI